LNHPRKGHSCLKRHPRNRTCPDCTTSLTPSSLIRRIRNIETWAKYVALKNPVSFLYSGGQVFCCAGMSLWEYPEPFHKTVVEKINS